MTDVARYVQLAVDRNRTWPWPKTDMRRVHDTAFGVDGTCPECRRRLNDGTMNLVLMSGGKQIRGIWVPHFFYDIWCMDLGTFEGLSISQELETGSVQWRGGDGGDAVFLKVPVHPSAMFDPAELEASTVAAHGRAGRECSVCKVWRWMPLGFGGVLPDPIVRIAREVAPPVIASAEIFGDGGKTFREILFRDDVAIEIEAAERGVSATGVATR